MENNVIEKQVKSKERVKDHGEVFTNKREVNAMLDLVKDEASRVNSRFLEPACGNGNFLVEILNRKLSTVKEVHSENLVDFQKHIFIAVGSIYAIDIQEDNCEESRQRMFDIVETFYLEEYPDGPVDFFFDAIKKVLELNVILGNGLTGLQVDEDNLDGYVDRPIVFSEWTWSADDKEIVRKDFTMNDMVAYGKRTSVNESSKKSQESNLFNLGGIKETVEELKPFKEFKKVNFMKAYKLK